MLNGLVLVRPDDLMGLTRRQALAGGAGAVAGAAGIYALVERHAGAPVAARAPVGAAAGAAPARRRPGGHRQRRRGARAAAAPRGRDGQGGDGRPRRQRAERLEDALAELESRYPATPAGLGVTVAWGLPYFRRHVPAQWERLQPVDVRAQHAGAARRGPLLERPGGHRARAERRRGPAPQRQPRRDRRRRRRRSSTTSTCFEKTTVRRGFAGGGLPSKLAVAAGVPGADLIPPEAELFLGFTSTLRENLGPSRIANLETLGLARIPQGYFTHGTHMHLSHIHENLERWYVNTAHDDRVQTTFRPGLSRAGRNAHGAPGRRAGVDRRRRAPRLPRRTARSATAARSRPRRGSRAGTSAPTGRSTRREPRSRSAPTSTRSTTRSPGAPTAASSADPAAGVHFVVFNPTSDDFNRVRRAMDGELPDGTTLAFEPRAEGQGFNSILRTTRRQNFLVPPRAHRSFPLSELRT